MTNVDYSTIPAGQQLQHGFDDIGNRESTKTGGDASGANPRLATYSANTLNQSTNRTVPGYVGSERLSVHKRHRK